MANTFLLIIDGGLLAQQYFGRLPNELKDKNLTIEEQRQFYPKILQASDGTYTNAVYGFMQVLLNIVLNQKPSHLIVTWDKSRATTFRRQLYPEYKAHRPETPEPLKLQQELCKKILTFVGIPQMESDFFEADDFTGSLSKKYEDEIYVRILTKDRDHLQLVNDKTNIWLSYPMDVKGKNKTVDDLYKKYGVDKSKMNVPDNVFRITKDIVKPYYGVEPDKVIELKALMGDTADNIPGLKGIGNKSAISLLENYESLEKLYSSIESCSEEEILKDFKNYGIRSGKKVLSALTELVAPGGTDIVGKKAVFLSKELATIKTDINFGDLPLEKLALNLDYAKMKASLQRLNCDSLINRFYL